VPTYIEFMSGFPATAIGKVDKKALPSLEAIKVRQGVDQDNLPQTEAEIKVAKVIQKILNLTSGNFDTGESFFDLGGNSLLTIPLLKELTNAFDGRKVTLDDIFVYPSIAELANYLSGGLKTGVCVCEERKDVVRVHVRVHVWY
jgi:acyl carrier protein